MNDPFSEEPVVTRENWRPAAKQAIDELPADIQASIGIERDDEDHVIFSIACAAISDGDSDTDIQYVDVRLRPSGGILPPPNSADEKWHKFEANAEGAELEMAFMAKWLCVSIDHGPDGLTNGVYLNRGSVQSLKNYVKEAVLETMWNGELIDKRGSRYFREDGTRIH